MLLLTAAKRAPTVGRVRKKIKKVILRRIIIEIQQSMYTS